MKQVVNYSVGVNGCVPAVIWPVLGNHKSHTVLRFSNGHCLTQRPLGVNPDIWAVVVVTARQKLSRDYRKRNNHDTHTC